MNTGSPEQEQNAAPMGGEAMPAEGEVAPQEENNGDEANTDETQA